MPHHDSARKEADEIPVVVLAHTVSDEGAVVVEPHHALAARLAVLCAWNLEAGQASTAQQAETHYGLKTFSDK